MPKYGSEVKDRVIALIIAGMPNGEIAAELGLKVNSVWRWRKEYEKSQKSAAETIENLKKQLANLSRRKPTSAIAHQIALVTKSIATLEGEEKRREKQKQKPKPQSAIAKNTDYETLKARALEIGGLYEYQRDFLNDMSQFRLVLKSRQIGFSFVSSLDALLGAAAGRNQLFLSASEEQALILMNYLDGWARKLGVDYERSSDYSKRLSNGAEIKVMAHNFRTVQGFTGDIWMDEFAWYPNPKKIWHAFVPSIGAVSGRLTILSTPFEERSFFHNLVTDESRFYMFSRHRVDIYRAMRDGLSFDLEVMRDLFDADTWASAYECQFIDDETALLPIALIKSCVEDYRVAADTQAAQFCGYDIGRVRDRSAFAAATMVGEKLKLSALETLSKATFAEQERFLGDYLRVNSLAILRIDKTGIGMATSERLKGRFGSRVQGVYFTQASKEAMALNLKKHLEEKTLIIPNDPLLIADLHAIKRKVGARGFIYDAERNERGHADRFWALALAASWQEKVRDRKGKAWIL
jgi:phage FluMu gp28-like protein